MNLTGGSIKSYRPWQHCWFAPCPGPSSCWSRKNIRSRRRCSVRIRRSQAQLDQRSRVRRDLGLPAILALHLLHRGDGLLVPPAGGLAGQIALLNQSRLNLGSALGGHLHRCLLLMRRTQMRTLLCFRRLPSRSRGRVASTNPSSDEWKQMQAPPATEVPPESPSRMKYASCGLPPSRLSELMYATRPILSW